MAPNNGARPRKRRVSTGEEADTHEVGNDQYISLSDVVYLHDEMVGGFLSVEGFTDFQLTIESEHELVSSPNKDFGQFAIFRLMPQQMYTMSKQLRSFEATPGESTPERELRRRQLMEEVRREKAHNESEVVNSAGREVRYGKVLQLQHVASGKLIAVSHLASAHNRDARRVHVSDADVGEAAWFRIMPKLRVHTEGEKVRAGEPVILENVMSGLKLQVGRERGLPGGATEVNASGDESQSKKQTFKMLYYRRQAEALPRGVSIHSAAVVRGGDAVRMIHRELDAFVGMSIARAKAHEDCAFLTDSIASRSSSTVFILEKADCRDGSAMRWDDIVRLRHVPSGMVLTAGTEHDHPQVNDSGQPGHEAANAFYSAASAMLYQVRGTSSSYKDKLRVLLTHDKQSPHTLFQFVPQYAPDGGAAADSSTHGSSARVADGEVHLGQIFGVRHVSSQLWLHNEMAAGVTRGAARAARSDAGQSALTQAVAKQNNSAKGWRAVQTAVQHGMGALTDKARRSDTLGPVSSFLCATRERHDEDMLALRRVPPEEYHDSLYTRSREHILVDVTQRMAAGTFDASSVEEQWAALHATHKCLRELIIFATQSDNTDPFTREGLPISSRQLLLAELSVFDLAIEACTLFSNMANQRIAARKAHIEAEKSREADNAAAAPPAAHYSSGRQRRSTIRSSNPSQSTNPMMRRQTTGLIDTQTLLDERSATAKKVKGSGTLDDQLTALGQLCMRLARHVLRGHSQNKKYGVRFVPQLQQLLGRGLLAAETLREVFTDNDDVLDMVTDEMIEMFVRLIRTKGRQVRSSPLHTSPVACPPHTPPLGRYTMVGTLRRVPARTVYQ